MIFITFDIKITHLWVVYLIGSVVTIEDEFGDEEEYKLVSSVESDPFNNKISIESPIGIAIKGHKTGDKVLVESPNGGYNIKILNVA